MGQIKENFLMFKCGVCDSANDVWFDGKGEFCSEDIYHCLKCGSYFMVSAVCDKCGASHSRLYGCNNRNCKCEDYHYDCEETEIARGF